MGAFIDQHRNAFGVEPICKVLQVAPSRYWRHVAQRRDAALMIDIKRVGKRTCRSMGPTRVWRQLHREGIAVAPLYGRRTHASLGSARRHPRQAHPRHGGGSPATSYPVDPVNRQFDAERPNPLGVSDFTDVSAWQCLVYMAFIIDVFARRIVAWNAASSKDTDLVMAPLRMAIWQRDRDGHPIVPGACAGPPPSCWW